MRKISFILYCLILLSCISVKNNKSSNFTPQIFIYSNKDTILKENDSLLISIKIVNNTPLEYYIANIRNEKFLDISTENFANYWKADIKYNDTIYTTYLERRLIHRSDYNSYLKIQANDGYLDSLFYIFEFDKFVFKRSDIKKQLQNTNYGKYTVSVKYFDPYKRHKNVIKDTLKSNQIIIWYLEK